MTRLCDLGVEELAVGICLRAGRIAAAESELPELAAAFGDGRVSYSKARAITRVAEPGDGIDWVELARHTSAAQLEKLVRGVRRAKANEAARLDPEAVAWALRTRLRCDDNGNFTMTISGPASFLPELQAGIEAKKAELQRERDAAVQQAAEQDVAAPPPPELVAEEPAAVAEQPPVPAPEEAPVRDEVDLDAPVAGWPPGTTLRQVRQALDAFHAGRAEEAEWVAQQPAAQEPTTAAKRAVARPALASRRTAGQRLLPDRASPRRRRSRLRSPMLRRCWRWREKHWRLSRPRIRHRPAPPAAADHTARPAVRLGPAG